MNRQALDALAARCGIEAEYWDIFGHRHEVSDKTKLALLRAMHFDIAEDDEASVQAALDAWEDDRWLRGLPPVLVRPDGEAPLELDLRWPEEDMKGPLNWTVLEEGGSRHTGALHPADLEPQSRRTVAGRPFVQVHVSIPAVTGLGYHQVTITSTGDRGATARMRLIVTPRSCYVPPGMGSEDRVWGPAVQLYALRSSRNWGMGDFTDLRHLVDLMAERGAGMVGLNPLHPLFPHDPTRRSPYSPSTRRFLNTLYVDVEAVPDFAECEEARRLVSQPRFQARLASLREAELVDVPAVSAVKREVLELLYHHFRRRHLERGTSRADAFRAYQARGGHTFWQHAVYQALAEHLHAQDERYWGWPAWPAEYRDPEGDAVHRFARKHTDRVEFYQYLQWQAYQQLSAAGRRSMELGLKVGLYEDLAVGVDVGGLETWVYRDLYALDARIGAPPDDFNPDGQEWGLPPLVPHQLAAAGYAPLIDILRANMRHGGALRIDHVMGLMRLFWIPLQARPVEGAYVRYPFEDLLGIVALESQRNHCMVVGEDLGTVPDEVRQALGPAGIHSYRVFYFEKDSSQVFKRPQDYPQQALVTVSTHDLPTLPGYWRGQDIRLRSELGLFPDQSVEQAQILARTQDRSRILMALSSAGLLPEDIGLDAAFLPALPTELIVAIHAYLARTPARMLTFQLEDILGQVDQVNLPGTIDQHPNWCRKLPATLDELAQDPRLEKLAETLRRERGVGRVTPDRDGSPGDDPLGAVIPRATYRLQMSRRFTLDHAAGLVPYLKRLGVSHCYLSPILKARPGSMHGYDIIDHNEINPEIGSRKALEHLAHILKQHGMGLILDMVPNHMGIGSDNPWWTDVLENGPASPYAAYFDIDWDPVKPQLRGKVLLPVLEDHYGTVLERGLLRLRFEAARGVLTLAYHEHRFPIDPGTYPILLTHGVQRLSKELGEKDPVLHEIQTLADALANLPSRHETAPARVSTRLRDQEVHKRHLARLCTEHEAIGRFVQENVQDFNGAQGDARSFDVLDRLLARQAYRLAFWRVASDEINYRRFFDINDLAGLSMENDEVFDATHRLVLELIGRGQIQGLRIDHPDGLRDPLGYCRRLQTAARAAQERRGVGAGRPGEDPDACSIYLVLEKILVGDEQLPTEWPVHGTTGYDVARDNLGVLLNTDAERDIERVYNRFVGRKTDFTELLHRCKKLIMQGPMAGELNVLATELARIAEADRHTRDFTLTRLKDSLGEVVACFPVYRTYVSPDGVSAEDRQCVEGAIARARSLSQATDVSIYDFIARILLLDFSDGTPGDVRRAATRFAMRFQQYTGPVMAKGMEDTAFYIYNRLLSLNDVGGDPTRFGLAVDAFHRSHLERRRRWPHSMVGSSTHDSKRSADVRARINVLAEVPDRWQRQVSRWSLLNRNHKRRAGSQTMPSKNDEYALYQMLLGAWPDRHPSGEDLRTLAQRMETAAIKAVREAKVHSSWINVNPQYEEALLGFLRALLAGDDGNRFLPEFLPFQERVAHFGMLNSLALTLLQLTVPGVPDLYQGEELWRLNLVDPDNRRPVDFEKRQAALLEIEQVLGGSENNAGAVARSLLESIDDGRLKLYVIHRALRLRAELPELFRSGGYRPLSAHGARSEHVCAYARHTEGTDVLVAVPRLCVGLLGFEAGGLPVGAEVWGDTWVALPQGQDDARWRHALTDEPIPVTAVEGQPGIQMAEMCRSFPLGLLVRGPAE